MSRSCHSSCLRQFENPTVEPEMKQGRRTVRPTLRGIGLACLVPTFWLSGRLLGNPELFALCAATAATWVGSGLLLIFAPLVPVLERSTPPTEKNFFFSDTLSPPSRLSMSYALQVRFPWVFPVWSIEERLSRQGAGEEKLKITGAIANQRTVVNLGPVPRGLYTLGPTETRRSDPFSLFQCISRIPGTTTFRRLPDVIDISSTLEASGVTTRTGNLRFLQETADEFHQLREFVSGDDTRRIHWRSSARKGLLLVRETGHEEKTDIQVVLDCRSSRYTQHKAGRTPFATPAPSFETAISLTASCLIALHRLGRQVAFTALPTSQHPIITQIRTQTDLHTAINALAEITLRSQEETLDQKKQTLAFSAQIQRLPALSLILCTGKADVAALRAVTSNRGRKTGNGTLIHTETPLPPEHANIEQSRVLYIPRLQDAPYAPHAQNGNFSEKTENPS